MPKLKLKTLIFYTIAQRLETLKQMDPGISKEPVRASSLMAMDHDRSLAGELLVDFLKVTQLFLEGPPIRRISYEQNHGLAS